jgi:hypothetical protein
MGGRDDPPDSCHRKKKREHNLIVQNENFSRSGNEMHDDRSRHYAPSRAIRHYRAGGMARDNLMPDGATIDTWGAIRRRPGRKRVDFRREAR